MAGPFPSSVLFCCDRNSVRSPMAEGLMKAFYGQRAYVQSAGLVDDREIDGYAVAACHEIGVDLTRHRSRSFDTMGPLGDDPASFDLVVALSPAAHGRVCAMAANHAFDVEFWPIDDPTRAGERRDERLAAFRAARDQIAARLRARFGPPNEDAAHAG
ncbi:MAG: low molecular weight phosphatase family protein [Rhodobacteraceae bacterium]|jgi:protein-tyrosine-phosphatase|nr:low molecular weight phosphatase family protein [Paracoccaceae bacterium]MBL4557077.1 low molecular weight phosphatase family protein [Paracoccaceae bacterium]